MKDKRDNDEEFKQKELDLAKIYKKDKRDNDEEYKQTVNN